jgi:asparagine synthase (glutamine-hydrolysing)
LRGFVVEDPSSADVLAKAYQQWDKDVVHHLRGAFAFALWDANRERLLLARDRFGEKPLYVCERAGSLYFASEMRALLRMPGIAAQPDPGAVHDYLAYRYVPAPRTLISGVRKLMPGTYALWQFGRLREVRYWFPPDRVACSGQPVGEPVAAFTEKLDEAVRLRAPGAGVLLSGGVDSAALLALVARHDTPQTFSAGFADDPESELPRAAALARHFGAEHHEIVLSPDDVVAALEYCVVQRDAPVSRPSDIALHLIAREAARTVGAVLTGDGSDEVLGGYRRHVAERFGWCFRSMPTLLLLAGPLARRRPELQTAFASLRTSDSQARYVRWVGAETRELLKQQRQAGRTNLPPFDADPRASSLRRALYFDQASWLPAGELAARQRARARRSHDDGRIARNARAVPRPQAGRAGLGAARPCARARPGDEVDPAPGGEAAAREAADAQGRLARAGGAMAARRAARISPRAPASAGLDDPKLLRTQSARPRDR